MKKFASILVALCAICYCAFAQAPTWFCSVPGTKLNYEKKDAKGNSGTQSYQYLITGCKTEGGRTTITYDVYIAGSKASSDCCVWSENGLFHTDATASLGQYGSGMTAKGNAPLLPENPELGKDLGNCSVSIESLMLNCDYTNVRFTSHETVTVPAGTFDCWCLEYDSVATVMGLKAPGRTKQWVAKGIGDVKVVATDKRGRTVSTSELVSVEK